VPSLLAKTGPLTGQRLEIRRELTVGRLDGDVVVDDAKLSRRHAVFRVVRGGLEVEDLGSTNGTFVQGRRIDGSTRLDDGVLVRLGSNEFVAEVEAVSDATILDAGPVADVTAARTVAVPRSPAQPAANPVPAPPAVTQVPAPAAATLPPSPAGRAHAPAVPAAPAPVGAFSPPAGRRGGLATRSWIPVALSYGSVLLTAIALVVYFAAR
jgi:pSer/pThr/pTyr-binding forkhead associated (FHA) protein